MMNVATPSQVLAILKRHARDEVSTLRLREMCRDDDRVASLVSVHNTERTIHWQESTRSNTNKHKCDALQDTVSDDEATIVHESRILVVDLSRQHMTSDTLRHLFFFASTRQIHSFIQRIAWGSNLHTGRSTIAPNTHGPSSPYLSQQQQIPQAHNKEGLIHPNPSNSESQPPKSVSPIRKTTRFHDSVIVGNQSYDHRDEFTNIAQVPSTLSGMTDAPSPKDGTSVMASVSSMHMSLRVPAGRGYTMYALDGRNILSDIHNEWARLRSYAESLRDGTIRGITGHVIRDVVVVGQGVPLEALRFVYDALLRDEKASLASRHGFEKFPGNDEGGPINNHMARLRRNLMGESSLVGSMMGAATNGLVGGSGEHNSNTVGRTTGSSTLITSTWSRHRRIKILSTIDPVATSEIISDLDPGTTLVISVAMRGSEETGLATRAMKSWLLQSLGQNTRKQRADIILARHMMLVTGNDRVAQAINKPESVCLILPECRCESFATFTAISILVRSDRMVAYIVLLLCRAHCCVHFDENLYPAPCYCIWLVYRRRIFCWST
jgi:hypothetical protein